MTVYSDLNQSSPTDSPLKADLEAVFQSIDTILNTRPGERIFRPNFGTDLEEELFEIIDEVTAIRLFQKITDSVENFEPRVQIDSASTQVIPKPEKGEYELILVFSVLGFEDQRFELRQGLSA